MLEYIMFAISFISLYIAVFWLNIFYIEKDDISKTKKMTRKPVISFLIPAYNEEKTIQKTIESITNVRYPKKLYEIIVINDGSKDNTRQIVEDLIKRHKDTKIRIINKRNEGKAASLNKGLKVAIGEFIGVVDADSTIDPDSVRYIVPHLYEKDVGAVISCIKVENPKNILEKVQYIEYLLSALIRRFFSSLDTLFVTPGVLSLYNKDIIVKLGGFDEENLTEDFEIAMRLQYHKYKVRSEINSITYTTVPNTLKLLERQRIRWARGFFYNIFKYRDMLFGKKHIRMKLQILLACIGIITLFAGSTIIVYGFLEIIYNYIIKAVTIMEIPQIYEIPTLKEFILNMNIKLAVPITVLTMIGLYFIKKAHDLTNEKIKISPILIVYIIFYPLLLAKYWIRAFIQEYRNTKKEW